jgi:hypothetical protein
VHAERNRWVRKAKCRAGRCGGERHRAGTPPLSQELASGWANPPKLLVWRLARAVLDGGRMSTTPGLTDRGWGLLNALASTETTLSRSAARGALLVVCVASAAFAQEVPSLVEAPRSARLAMPTSEGRSALLIGSQIASLAASAATSVFAGALWPMANFEATGRPDPRVFAGSVGLALAVNIAITLVLLPELTRLTNDANGTVEVGFVRRETWRVTRWVALAGLVFVGVLIAGAVAEKNGFGQGQTAMALGAVGAAASALTFDVTALFESRHAAAESRAVAQ